MALVTAALALSVAAMARSEAAMAFAAIKHFTGAVLAFLALIGTALVPCDRGPKGMPLLGGVLPPIVLKT